MKKFLIIRFSSIGDMVLTTPVVRCLKKQYPDAEVHYITKEQFLPVIESNPYIDKIYTIREDVAEVLKDLKRENYDHIVDLHKNFRSREICMKLKPKCSSFNKINISKWLLVNFKVDRLPDVHIVDRYFGAVSSLGVYNDGLGLDYFIPAEVDKGTFPLPDSHRMGFIGWVIGGKHNTKIYPEEKVIEICKKIHHPIILIGGPEDVEKGDRIVRAAGNHVYNSCGRSTLHQSSILVRNASLILTNDTGMMHIAAAFKKPVISFWGNTVPGFGMYPYMPGEEGKSHMLEISDLSCRPCSKIGFTACPKGHFDCMNRISTEKVLDLISEFYKA